MWNSPSPSAWGQGPPRPTCCRALRSAASGPGGWRSWPAPNAPWRASSRPRTGAAGGSVRRAWRRLIHWRCRASCWAPMSMRSSPGPAIRPGPRSAARSASSRRSSPQRPFVDPRCRSSWPAPCLKGCRRSAPSATGPAKWSSARQRRPPVMPRTVDRSRTCCWSSRSPSTTRGAPSDRPRRPSRMCWTGGSRPSSWATMRACERGRCRQLVGRTGRPASPSSRRPPSRRKTPMTRSSTACSSGRRSRPIATAFATDCVSCGSRHGPTLREKVPRCGWLRPGRPSSDSRRRPRIGPATRLRTSSSPLAACGRPCRPRP